MYECLVCRGSFPLDETLQDVMDPGDTGPVCVHCYSRLTRIATGRRHANDALAAQSLRPVSYATAYGVVTL